MAERKLIEELRRLADLIPPICQYDQPEDREIFGKKITVYCKPFEQFQEVLRSAADALSADAVEVVRCKDCYLGENCTCVCCEDGEMVLCRMRHKHMPADAFCSDGWREENG